MNRHRAARRIVTFVPENQLWTTEEPHRTRIAKGMAWAAATPRAETDLDELTVQARRSRILLGVHRSGR
jgi:hypothetical protein